MNFIVREQVALRAYYISERRRNLGFPGDETSDWLAAEREISEELNCYQFVTTNHNRAVLTCDLMVGRVKLGNRVSEMIAGFQRNREEMAEKSKAELAQSRADRESTISEVITWFQLDRQEMGQQTKAERREFVSSVKEAVAALRQNTAKLRAEFSADILGARTAWSGGGFHLLPVRAK